MVPDITYPLNNNKEGYVEPNRSFSKLKSMCIEVAKLLAPLIIQAQKEAQAEFEQMLEQLMKILEQMSPDGSFDAYNPRGEEKNGGDAKIQAMMETNGNDEGGAQKAPTSSPTEEKFLFFFSCLFQIIQKSSGFLEHSERILK